MDGDVISFVGSLLYGCEDVFRDEVEGIAGNPEKKKKLVVVLETVGGYIEVVQRIAETIRHHYETVEFVVPSYAMSAGTVLVMSGDTIYMDYFSILGPIDPQVEKADGTQVPALGYLIQFDRLLKKAEEGDAEYSRVDTSLLRNSIKRTYITMSRPVSCPSAS